MAEVDIVMPVDAALPVDLFNDGILWLINKAVFHPRGFALSYAPESGFFFLNGDGTEAWSFTAEVDAEKFIKVEALFKEARDFHASGGLEGLLEVLQRVQNYSEEVRNAAAGGE